MITAEPMSLAFMGFSGLRSCNEYYLDTVVGALTLLGLVFGAICHALPPIRG